LFVFWEAASRHSCFRQELCAYESKFFQSKLDLFGGLSVDNIFQKYKISYERDLGGLQKYFGNT
jgi:hypothetical protein